MNSTDNIVMLDPTHLVAHPDNPRGDLKEKDVADLVPVIEAQGQQQPCIVRPAGGPEVGGLNGMHEIVIGHRRALACRVLKRKVACVIVPFTEDQALAVMLADNPSHAAPDPLRESEAVAAFLKFDGFTLKDVADRLGKSPRWVAQRANLQRLSPRVRAVLGDRAGKDDGHTQSRIKTWPVSWLERLATLAPEAQDQVLGQHWVESAEDLEVALATHTRQLAHAPWDLEDATLVPEAGSCAECPKQSGRCPGLFDDGTQAVPLKKSVCMDAGCWGKKLERHGAGIVKELREKHPGLIACRGQYSGDKEEREPLPHPGIKEIQNYYLKPAKKDEKGAVPALVVDGKGRGTVVWKKVKREYSQDQAQRRANNGGSKPAKPLSPAAQAKAQLAVVAARRREWVMEEFLGRRLGKFQMKLHGAQAKTNLLALVALFGLRSGMNDREIASKTKAAVAGNLTLDDLWQMAWDGLVYSVGDDSYLVEEVEGGVEAFAQLCGFDLKALEAEAVKKIPDPKVVKELPPAKGAKKKAGKKKPPVADTLESAASPDGDE